MLRADTCIISTSTVMGSPPPACSINVATAGAGSTIGGAPRHQRPIVSPRQRVDDTIHRREDLRGRQDRTARFVQALQRNAAGPFVEQQAIDREKIGAAVERGDDMRIPDRGGQWPRRVRGAGR